MCWSKKEHAVVAFVARVRGGRPSRGGTGPGKAAAAPASGRRGACRSLWTDGRIVGSRLFSSAHRRHAALRLPHDRPTPTGKIIGTKDARQWKGTRLRQGIAIFAERYSFRFNRCSGRLLAWVRLGVGALASATSLPVTGAAQSFGAGSLSAQTR